MQQNHHQSPSLKNVYLDPTAYYACFNHALSIETEEIMGVLLGAWNNDQSCVHITSILPLQRMGQVRAKDRVEVEPTHMVAAQEEAERIGARVVGWYHSHPHITVLPSHVDSRTQGSLQSLGSGFVGLIFEAFSHDSRTGTGSLNAIAFQSDWNKDQNCWEYHTVETDLSTEVPNFETIQFQDLDLDLNQNLAGSNNKNELRKKQQISKSDSIQARGMLALVKQLQLAFKEEKERYEDSVSDDKCCNHLRKMSCCGNYQQVLAELSEASIVL
tara:strand:- start:17 stop:832 length:816 start_codon:yes stop_codon:yes gene_type:complete